LKHADKENGAEIERLKRCHFNAQQILIHMNSGKRDFENSKKLAELQSRLDISPFYRVEHPLVREFCKFNIQKQGFVFDGPLRMRRLDNTIIEMHGVLCDELLLLLTKRGLGADERLRLQFHEETIAVGARQSVLVQFCPIIKLVDAKLKDAASSDKNFYLISTCNEVTLYHLETPNPESKVKWMKHIQAQIAKLSPTDKKDDNAYYDVITDGARVSDGPDQDGLQAPAIFVDGVEDDPDFDDFSDEDEEEEDDDEYARAHFSNNDVSRAS